MVDNFGVNKILEINNNEENIEEKEDGDIEITKEEKENSEGKNNKKDEDCDKENSEINENISSLNKYYNLNDNRIDGSVLNFGNYIKYTLNTNVKENIISYIIDKDEEISDDIFYKALNFDEICEELKENRLVVLNDERGKGKFYTAVNLIFKIEEVNRTYIIKPSTKSEIFEGYKFKKNSGYILYNSNYSKNYENSINFLVNKLKELENSYLVIAINKEIYNLEYDNCYFIEKPNIKETLINYLAKGELENEYSMQDNVKKVLDILGDNFLSKITFEKIPKLAESLYYYVNEKEKEGYFNNLYKKRKNEIINSFKHYKTDPKLMVKNFFSKNTVNKDRLNEVLSLVAAIALFENTDIDFIIEKAGKIYDLISSNKGDSNSNNEFAGISKINFLLAGRNFSEILNDIWAEEIEIKRNENEDSKYGCENIKVLRFNDDDLRGEYLKYIWNNYVGLRVFILRIFSEYVGSPESRNTISLVEAFAILAKYDIENILYNTISNWVEKKSNVNNPEVKNQRINAAFLLTEIYRNKDNEKNIEYLLEKLKNSNEKQVYKKLRNKETAVFVYTLLLADGIYIIELKDLLNIYSECIEICFGELSNYVKHSFFVLLENYSKNDEKKVRELFEFIYIQIIKRLNRSKGNNEYKYNENVKAIYGLFLYQIKEYKKYKEELNINYLEDFKIKKMMSYIILSCLENSGTKKRTYNALSFVFKKTENNSREDSFIRDLKILCYKISKKLKGEERNNLVKCIKGEYK